MCAASLRPVLPAVPAGQGLESGTHPLAASLTGADRAGARAVGPPSYVAAAISRI